MGSSLLIAAADSAPAGGAAIDQVVIGTLAVATIELGVLALCVAHRRGRTRVLDRIARPLAWVSGVPGWAALPAAVSLLAFLCAGPGFVWDVATHIANGRDAGPFANPSHYMLIAGTVGFAIAGVLAVCMPRGDMGPAAIRLSRDWQVPPAALAMLACGLFSLSGFPADDVWHRLFGQDVTLWGPTHLMMITGGLLHFCAMVLLVREGRLARGGRPKPLMWLVAASFGSVVLVGMTVAYQQEFQYGVPQFRLLFHPVLLALASSLALVGSRVALGRGAALVTALLGAGTLGVLAVFAGPIMGEPTMHFPLYLAEAVLVELAAAFLARRGPYAVAIAAGGLIGTVGTLAEAGWSHVWMPIPWPAHILPEAMALATIVGIGGAVVGAFAGMHLTNVTVARRAWLPPAVGLLAAGLVLATLLHDTVPTARAHVAFTDAGGGAQRTAYATVRFTPAEAARDADWLMAMAWQGKEHRFVLTPLRPVGPGTYRSRAPLPLYGTWKSAIRLARGDVMGSVPLHLPADSALGLPAYEPARGLDRPLMADRRLMQRERKGDVPGWMFATGSALVAAATALLLALLGWALLRVARGGPGPRLPRGSARLAAAP